MASQITETTALLVGNSGPGDDHAPLNRQEYSATDAESGAKSLTTDLQSTRLAEAILLAKSSVPLMLTYVLQYSFNVITVIVAGHLGTAELAAVSLASMTANITGLCVYEGLATSLDTLCSQAYGGANKKMVGLHVQRMVYFLWLVTIPIAAVWICSPYILSAIVPQKGLAVLAGSYLRIFLIGAPGYATFEAWKRFLQAQGMFTPSLIVLLISAPLNVVLNWVFVWVRNPSRHSASFIVSVSDQTQKLGFGLRGAAAAASLTNILQPILLLLYIRFIIPSSLECWPGFSRKALKNWGPMIRLAVPGILMIEAEWLAFDILTFSSAFLGEEQLAAQSVLFNVSVLIYHVPFPASVAASTRLGNLIGSGSLRAARIAVSIYYVIFVGIGLFDLSFLVVMRDVIPKIFSNDNHVRDIVSNVMPLVAAFQLVDSTTALCNGLLRGLGRQSIGGWANLLIYYVVSGVR